MAKRSYKNTEEELKLNYAHPEEGDYDWTYDHFVSEVLPEIKELLDKGSLKESKLSEDAYREDDFDFTIHDPNEDAFENLVADYKAMKVDQKELDALGLDITNSLHGPYGIYSSGNGLPDVILNDFETPLRAKPYRYKISIYQTQESGEDLYNDIYDYLLQKIDPIQESKLTERNKLSEAKSPEYQAHLDALWEEGYQAYYDGEAYTDYPTGLTHAEAQEWMCGWDAANEEDWKGHSPIKESSGRRSYKMFTGRAEDGRVFKGTYISKTHMISCLKPIVGKNAIVTDVADLPQVVTSELLNEYPEYVTLIGSNSTDNYDIYRTIVFKNLGYCVGDRLGTYIVKDIDEVKAALRKVGALNHAFAHRNSPEGKEVLWTEAFEWIRSKPKSAFLESSSNDVLTDAEKDYIIEMAQMDYECGGCTYSDDLYDVIAETLDTYDKAKLEAGIEFYQELAQLGPVGMLHEYPELDWSDDYKAEYGEFDSDDEVYSNESNDVEEECYDYVEDGLADINNTADWYKISRIEGLMYMNKGMTAEEAKAKLGIDPSYVYVPTGNLKHTSFEEL